MLIPVVVHAQQTQTTEEVVSLPAFDVTEMRSLSDQAIEGRTPVAFTEVPKSVIAGELASQDLPLVLNSTPSVFATTDGGAAGDARVNVRGFNQRNVAILINGVPTNDIENGWLYWSNWDALGDVTSTIQVQRGMSNVTLPMPSIGGTMNIITDPAASRRSGSVKLEAGSDSFMKANAVFNTGLMKDKVAFTVGLVAKQGDGYARGTWVEGYGYYLGATWKVNARNRLELFAIGSPQQHGQRRFASNIAAYDIDFARGLGYTDAQIYSTSSGANAGALRQGPVGAGRDYNQNVAPVSSSYAGLQYYWGGTHARKDRNFLNESVNYFHKPQVNLNWYSTLSDRLKLSSVIYYSGGRGGGSGTLNNGSSSAAFGRYPNSDTRYGSNINWDATIASNAGAVAANGSAKTPGRSLGILRNSVNNQDQFGIVSKLAYELSNEWKFTAGADWRTAEITHFREVRDLLGGEYYLPTVPQASQFWDAGTNTQLRLGDRVDYNNTNSVDWLGLFLQGQYEHDRITAFGVVGYSSVKFGYEDLFRRASPGSNATFKLDSNTFDGKQAKGGLQYSINANLGVYANAGWVTKAPIFDGAINDTVGQFVKKPQNEKFKSVEAGLRYLSPNRNLNVSAGYYFTQWRDRTVSITSETADTITYLYGLNSDYAGLEIEAAYRVNRWLRFDAAASFGDWIYTDDVLNSEQYFISTQATNPAYSGKVYSKNLKVGDAPQSQIAYAVTFRPTRGLSLKLQGRWYDRYWSDYTPESRGGPDDRAQPWKIPSYSIYDLHTNYDLPFGFRNADISVFLHILNLTDKVYISDATDNSQFEAVGLNLAPSHSAQRAEVFFGPPITFNCGVRVTF
ncbi:MAG: TonB-dependent receptor plug domain-containing protein [Opitutaceae bacterium]|nr:TonB-dependent receptor plug domain-containing protein [Opitutaceae bacterium]